MAHTECVFEFHRCLALRCPACGASGIFAKLFQVKEQCEACGVLLKREEGFFVGAIMVAVVTTEMAIVIAYLISLPFVSANYQLVIAGLLGLMFRVAPSTITVGACGCRSIT